MKKVFTILMTFVMAMCITTSAFAAETPTVSAETNSTDTAVTPRIGHAGYGYYYHNGNSIEGSFTFSVNTVILPMNQWTGKTSGFGSNAWVTVDIHDPSGRQVNQATVSLGGNNEAANRPLVPGGIVKGTYTVHFNVWNTSNYTSSLPGAIEVWVY